MEYEDINYQLAQADDQSAIFDGYCAFLNSFDSSLPFQLSFINHRSRPESKYKLNIPMKEDGYSDMRSEYVEMLEGQICLLYTSPEMLCSLEVDYISAILLPCEDIGQGGFVPLAAVILVERLIFTGSPPPVFHIESGGWDLLLCQIYGDLVAVLPADKQTENQTDNLGGFLVDYPKILGHTDQNAILSYARLDMEQLRGYALPPAILKKESVYNRREPR